MLVALEGIDGSGKSTIARRVARRLRASGFQVRVTQEPTKTRLGRLVRAGIRGRMDPLALAFLFLSDRAAHVRTFPASGSSEILITDRYADSTTSYQAAALVDRVPNALELLQTLQSRIFPTPELAILLDLPAESALKRIEGRSVKEPFEKLRFLRRVRSNYLRLAKGGRLVVVSADAPAEVVTEKVAQLVERAAAKTLRR